MTREELLKETELISKLTDEEKFMLTAFYFSNMPQKEKTILAYEKSRNTKLKSTKTSLYIQASRWLNLPQSKAFLNKIERDEKNKYNIANKLDEGGEEVTRNKQELEIILNSEISKAQKTGDSKLLSDAIRNLNLLNQYNKELNTDEIDNLIHFYLPLKCNKCTLYQKQKKKQLKTKKKG